MDTLNLPGTASCTVAIHPVVLFTITDAFVRRDEGKPRVIGTLLGNTNADGVVEIHDCYAVPHKEEEGEELLMDLVHQRTLMELHQKVYPKNVVVGWFSTYPRVTTADNLFHSFFSSQFQTASGPPMVLLTLDCLLTAPLTSGITTYVSRPLDLSISPDGVGMQFVQVPSTVLSEDLEVLNLTTIASAAAPTTSSPMTPVASSFARLREMIDTILPYVEAVASGQIVGDNAVGRQLARALADMPQMGQDAFAQLCMDGTQDVLLAAFLANLLRTHITLADKLGTAQLPIA